MRAIIKHLIQGYSAIDDEIVVIEDGIVSVYAFDVDLAVGIANWLISHMADRNLTIAVYDRGGWDYRVSIVPKRRIGA